MVNKELIEKIRKFVKNECEKDTSKYSYDHYIYHIIPVYKNAKKLARTLNANQEIVELSALLHDIGSVIHGRKDHHITGANIAEKELEKLEYPKEKIRKIRNCILNHRGSINHKRKTIEEQIIADADAMSHFDSIDGQFQAAFIFEKKTQNEARKSVKKKLINSWNKLSLRESKILIRPKYEAAMFLLK